MFILSSLWYTKRWLGFADIFLAKSSHRFADTYENRLSYGTYFRTAVRRWNTQFGYIVFNLILINYLIFSHHA